MKKRLFLAIPLSDSLLEKFSGLKDRYALETGIRWTTKQNLHVTVYFFGDTDEEKIPEMSKKIAQVTAAYQKFDLEFEQIMFAPPNRPPRMVWADFRHSEAYIKLCGAIYESAKPFLDHAFAQSLDRDPHPHITLARFNNPAAAKSLKLEPIPPETMPAAGCELVASELTRSGPVYTILEHYAFT
jgi:RNA 2',3'-cyclic 3'-phosphodiesterase